MSSTAAGAATGSNPTISGNGHKAATTTPTTWRCFVGFIIRSPSTGSDIGSTPTPHPNADDSSDNTTTYRQRARSTPERSPRLVVGRFYSIMEIPSRRTGEDAN